MQFIATRISKNILELISKVESNIPLTILGSLLIELNGKTFQLYGGISKQEALYPFLYWLLSGLSYKKLKILFDFPYSNMKQVLGVIQIHLRTYTNRQFDLKTFEEREFDASQVIDFDELKIFSTRLDHLFFGFPTLKCDGVQIRIKKQTNLEVAKCSSYKFHQKTAISFVIYNCKKRHRMNVTPCVL